MSDISEPVPGYKILDNLGEGGFARVFLAEQTALERNVALKVMSPKLANDVDYCERFLREGKTLARLSNHPDIVTIYDIGQVDRFYFMSMEYLDGSDLKSRMGADGYEGDAAGIVKTVANALGFAHGSGIVHRDIKPANVLFSQSGTAVLSDFGISKTLTQTDVTLTIAGTQMGTPSYMSPEQCRGEVQIDGRSDLYSLGVMFFEMLSGHKPFTGANHMAVIAAHLNNPIPQLPEAHAKFQPLIEKLMAKSVDDRYATAEDFIDDLDSLAVPAATQGKHQSKSVVLMSVIGVAVAAIAIGAWVYQSNQEEEIPLVAVPSQGLSQEDHDKVQRLLDSGQMHEIVGRFVAPPGSNALDAYRIVLEIDPDNGFASNAVDRLISEHGEK